MFSHTLNLIVRRLLSNVVELTKLILNLLLPGLNIGNDVLRKLTGGDGKLIQEVPTRWNSTFYIYQFLSSHPFVNEILNKNITATEIISALCVLNITEVIKVLNRLDAATKELCGDFYVTSSIIIPMIHILQNKIIQQIQ